MEAGSNDERAGTSKRRGRKSSRIPSLEVSLAVFVSPGATRSGKDGIPVEPSLGEASQRKHSTPGTSLPYVRC